VSEQFAITMLGGFEVYRDDRLLDLPPSCRRVVALAALKRRALPRGWMCRVLWPTTRPDRATARLRTTLWRLRPMGADALLIVNPQSIEIAPDVRVDWYDAVDLMGQLLGHADRADADRDLTAELLPLLRAGALLDGWKEEWNEYARSTYRDLRLDCLEVLMGACAGNG
jgi:DNA-binding SARP family transcriptional activator